ncbi:LysE family translocator [Agreia bicolorata]|uniref:Threonine/homoserine/homoserine lactone efflux protein n=1 Tax=Agreia bicolorata TaxID=110935 RepID=A0ABR5CGL1_9MICO|nr:LysE family translocator [Agreia bicolorata]KJC64642.1 hypothetical protein TZ00_09935 [Agreia bicolorata]
MPDYLPFIIAYAVTAFTPGVEAATIVGAVLSGRRRDVVPLGAGLLLSKVLFLIIALLGATALAALLGPWFVLLRYAGAAWLLWLAFVRVRRSFRAAPPELAAEKKPRRAGGPFLLGAALTLGNPLALTFYFAILPSVIPVGASPWNVAPVLILLVVTIMGTVIATYALLAHLLLNTLRRHARATDLIAAGLLVIAALMIVFS